MISRYFRSILAPRRQTYMAEKYGEELWFFHDCNAHELPLRIQSTELRTEPLVLDLTRHGNRLRYLRDRREDPLELSEVLPMEDPASESSSQAGSGGVGWAAGEASELACWPSRSAMARINSRSLPPPPLAPTSPSSRPPESLHSMQKLLEAWLHRERRSL